MSAFSLGVRTANAGKPVWWVRQFTRQMPRKVARQVQKGYVLARRMRHAG